MNEKEIMTVKQVSEYLQMDEHTVYKLARKGLIPSLKIAGQWLMTRARLTVFNEHDNSSLFSKVFSGERAGAGKWEFYFQLKKESHF